MSEEYTLKEYICVEFEKLKEWHDNNKVRCTEVEYKKNMPCGVYSSLKRRALFSNAQYTESAYDDVFCLMIQIYEYITGKQLRFEHMLNKQWLILLERRIEESDTNVKKAIIDIVKRCLKPGSYKYIKDINDVMKMEEYEVIKKGTIVKPMRCIFR